MVSCLKEVTGTLKEGESIASVGITNQRETTIAFDASTGKALHNSLVWLDARTKSVVKKI